jgi:SAM-dependent methyltransferase
VRDIREWLAQQVSAGYVSHDSRTDRFVLPEEHAIVLADENSPAFMGGAFQLMISALKSQPKVIEAFKIGNGIDWSEHDSGVFEGQERFNRPNYRANIVSSWIPALDGGNVLKKLELGAKVADIGCGYGYSTLVMAKAFPKSKFFGFDTHRGSIEHARGGAEKEGLKNITFEVASSIDFPGIDYYDLITFFDCFHDMGDPVGAARRTLKALKQNGTCMLVEVLSGDRLEDNANPLGQVAYTGSIFICIPNSLASHEIALGAMPGPSRIGEIMKTAGFRQYCMASKSAFNMVLEAKP